MGTNEKHIVAIDLGTSKIALTVAKVNNEDIQIIYYKETPSAGIRYSGVVNIMHAKDPLAKAIAEAEEELGIKITQAVVGMPKFPVLQKTSNAKIPDRGEDTDITAEDVNTLKEFAKSLYPLEDPSKEAIFGAVAQSFSDGENFQIIEDDIIGMTSDVLEGNFKIFIGKKSDLKKIDTVMSRVEVASMRKYFTAESSAKAVLTDSEMENGVALIDFGGGSTSVSIYQGNIMRHFASIPFGGKNITNDIKTECQITEQLAENIKIAFGACMPEKLQSLSDKIIHIRSNSTEPDKQLSVKYLSEIITARVEEILMAILYEIEISGFADRLRSGIVVTGGCARTANICNFILDLSGYKARVGYPKPVFSHQGCEGITETSAVTSVGLILASVNDNTVNCTIAQSDIPTEVELKVIGEDGNEEVAPEGCLFKESEIEKVDPRPKVKVKKDEGKNGLITLIFKKVKSHADKAGEFVGNLYEEIVNEENQYNDTDDNDR